MPPPLPSKKKFCISPYFLLASLQYFASGLPQNGAGEVGGAISGFLLKDIRQELNRGLKIKCSGCHQPGGFVGCAVRTCKRAGHFPCLHRLGYTFQYSGEFRTYCPQHSPTQPTLHSSDCSLECCICLAPVSSKETIYCPCCLATFHKPCIQVRKKILARVWSLQCCYVLFYRNKPGQQAHTICGVQCARIHKLIVLKCFVWALTYQKGIINYAGLQFSHWWFVAEMHNGKLVPIMPVKTQSIAMRTYACVLKAGHTPLRLGVLPPHHQVNNVTIYPYIQPVSHEEV